jgi:peptidoglycan/xylan/chitin deacetylase (PgdA/CDA1 family)
MWSVPQTQHASAAVRAPAAKAGYPTCLSYDVDSLDYTDPPPDTAVQHTLNGVRRGSVVSMHFGHAATIAAMPRVLAGLRARGPQVVTVTELVPT